MSRGVRAIWDRLTGSAGRSEPGAPAPMPCIVGVPRSGTTLLRLMLDAHPQLAIPAETGFAMVLPALPADASREQLAAALESIEVWSDVGFDAQELRALFAATEPWDVSDGLRAIFRAYAARHGKSRWGDKTPGHCLSMTEIARVLPEARFIHIIRDGRDVAVSLRGLSIDPGGIAASAAMWRDQITEARRQAADLPWYREIRYERLVAEPEPVLRELCDFVELDFDAVMLRSHERAPERHAELHRLRAAAGRPMLRETHERWQGFTERPPDTSRAGRWREQLSAADVAVFEQAAGEMLDTLGYPR